MVVRFDIILLVVWALIFALIVILGIILCCCHGLNPDLETGLASYSVRADRAVRASRPSTVGIIVRYKNEEEIESRCTDCVICMEGFKDGDSCRLLVNCKHLYHQLCVDQWLVKNGHCPLCRGSVHSLELISTIH
ncbi:hypothetical protein V6N13_004316 [Hibiscus sabdariffa]|uniref:RING-type E3 ubiquitin transferase n=1 Tax=Hibiscus sabdariffa TaxID=183260 RepID=A0ABR2RYY2_9ROSI